MYADSLALSVCTQTLSVCASTPSSEAVSGLGDFTPQGIAAMKLSMWMSCRATSRSIAISSRGWLR